MTDKPNLPLLNAMTKETAAVCMSTELIRHALNGDMESLHREAVAMTLMPPDWTAHVMAQLATTCGAVLSAVPDETAHDFLDRLMLRAQFDQLTEGMNPEVDN